MDKANDNLKKHYQNNYLDDKSSQKKISNSLWLKNNFDTNENFVNVLESKYYSDFYSVDFTNNQTIENIAKWVNFNTKDFLEKTSKDYEYLNNSLTYLTLINTIYFKCAWYYNSSLETKETFNGLNSSKNVDYFYKSAKGTFLKQDQYLIFNDTFVSKDKVYYILPNENVNLKDLMTDEKTLNEITDFIKNNNVDKNIVYKAPEFDMKYSDEFVEKLGKIDYSLNDIKLDNIVLNENLTISQVVQGNRIVFSKNGVEAASETNVGSFGDSVELPDLNVVLNRPFMFIITDSQNTPLFTGSLFDL